LKPRDLSMFVALAAVWGASFLFMRIAAPHFGVWWTAEARSAIAFVVMLAVGVFTGRALLTREHWPKFLVVGTFNSAVPFALYAYAALHLPTGYSAILNALTPLWAAVFAAFMLGEKLTWRVMLGVVIAMGGVSLLVKADHTSLSTQSLLPVLACVLATVCYGFTGAFTKKTLTGVPSFANAANSQLFAALVLLPFAAMQLPAVTPPVNAWAAMLPLGVLCTAAAYFMYFALLSSLGPTKAGSVTFVIPAFGMFWGWLFLQEPITLNMLAGFALVLVATTLVMGLGPFKPKISTSKIAI
jgi:drug/metabolite transporter (DMT)-like permease